MMQSRNDEVVNKGFSIMLCQAMSNETNSKQMKVNHLAQLTITPAVVGLRMRYQSCCAC